MNYRLSWSLTLVVSLACTSRSASAPEGSSSSSAGSGATTEQDTSEGTTSPGEGTTSSNTGNDATTSGGATEGGTGTTGFDEETPEVCIAGAINQAKCLGWSMQQQHVYANECWAGLSNADEFGPPCDEAALALVNCYAQAECDALKAGNACAEEEDDPAWGECNFGHSTGVIE